MRYGFADHDVSTLFGLDARLARVPALVCDRCGEAALDGQVIESAERTLGGQVVCGTGPLRSTEVRFLRGGFLLVD